MTHLRQRMIEDMQLRGLSELTQENYVRAVRQLAEHYGKSPDRIDEEELRHYFLYLKNDKQVAAGTFGVALYGIKFLYQHTLQQAWPTFDLARSPREKKLPVVLSIAEVHRILGCIRRQRYRVCLSTIYACGLRVQEGVHLQVRDIDSERMVVHVRHGKRSKDRYVPLPTPTLLSYPDALDVVLVYEEVTAAVNGARAEHRVTPLQWDEDLQELAEWQAWQVTKGAVPFDELGDFPATQLGEPVIELRACLSDNVTTPEAVARIAVERLLANPERRTMLLGRSRRIGTGYDWGCLSEGGVVLAVL